MISQKRVIPKSFSYMSWKSLGTKLTRKPNFTKNKQKNGMIERFRKMNFEKDNWFSVSIIG